MRIGIGLLGQLLSPRGERGRQNTQDHVNRRGLEQIQAPEIRPVSSELRLTVVFSHHPVQHLFPSFSPLGFDVFLYETVCHQTRGRITFFFSRVRMGFRVSPARLCWSPWLPRRWRSTKERNTCTSSCWTFRSQRG